MSNASKWYFWIVVIDVLLVEAMSGLLDNIHSRGIRSSLHKDKIGLHMPLSVSDFTGRRVHLHMTQFVAGAVGFSSGSTVGIQHCWPCDPSKARLWYLTQCDLFLLPGYPVSPPEWPDASPPKHCQVQCSELKLLISLYCGLITTLSWIERQQSRALKDSRLYSIHFNSSLSLSTSPDLRRDINKWTAPPSLLKFEFYNGAMSTRQCEAAANKEVHPRWRSTSTRAASTWTGADKEKEHEQHPGVDDLAECILNNTRSLLWAKNRARFNDVRTEHSY